MKLALTLSIAAATLASAAAAQSVTSGQLLTSKVTVTTPAASPAIVLHIKGYATSINLTYTGPSHEIFAQSFTDYNGGYFGEVTLQGYDSAFAAGVQSVAAFSLYAQPGKWSLTSLSVCGSTFPCPSYSGKKLSALFGAKLSFQLVNPNPYDIEPPKAEKALVLTPTISISAGPVPKISMRVTDNLSGLGEVQVCSTNTPFGGTTICFNYFNPPRPILSGTVTLTGSVASSTQGGTYTINSVSIVDIAGNTSTITDPTAITTLFAGQPFFTVID